MIVYFSGTGNSRRAAQLLADRLDDDLLDAFQYLKHQIAADLCSGKPWVFVSPTYAWRIPRIFQQFLESGSFAGSDDAYFVMTCGSEIGNAAAYLRPLCEKLGKRFRGAAQVVMPENYLAMFQVPEEAEAREILARADQQLKRTAETIRAGEDLTGPAVGLADRLKSGPVNRAFYPLIVRDKKFFATDACISCGRCAEACVLGNITLESGRPRWHGSCTHCMACITVCPVQAIEYGRISVGKPRYRCPPWRSEAPEPAESAAFTKSF